jgi:hypothetical protein
MRTLQQWDRKGTKQNKCPEVNDQEAKPFSEKMPFPEASRSQQP